MYSMCMGSQGVDVRCSGGWRYTYVSEVEGYVDVDIMQDKWMSRWRNMLILGGGGNGDICVCVCVRWRD